MPVSLNESAVKNTSTFESNWRKGAERFQLKDSAKITSSRESIFSKKQSNRIISMLTKGVKLSVKIQELKYLPDVSLLIIRTTEHRI
jgi:hypothetical protein